MKRKRGFRNWIQAGCVFIVLTVGGYLLFANIFHVISLNGRKQISLKDTSYQVAADLLQELSDKNKQLEAVTQTELFLEEELTQLKNYLNRVEVLMQQSDYWNYDHMIVSDVNVYQYLTMTKEMIPDSKSMSAIHSLFQNKSYHGISLYDLFGEKILAYDSYADYELMRLQDNDHYYVDLKTDEKLTQTLTFAQSYVIQVLEDHIQFANFLLEDGGAI